MSSSARPRLHGLANLAVLGLVLCANALAGSGALSGESIGLIANRYASTFLPAGWVFGIWSLIYLWLAAFAVYQVLPGQRDNPALARLGWGWALNGALNIAWIATFSFSLFGPALLVMVALLVNLIWIGERVGWGQRPLTRADRLWVAYPFGLYLAWISVALIANTFQYLTYLEWGGLGVSAEVWSAIMMIVGTGLAAFLARVRGNWLFPLVFGWAFIGIADRFDGVPLIANTAYVMTAVGVVLVVGTLAGWLRPGARGPLATSTSGDPAS